MHAQGSSPDLQSLLRHAGWLRALATHLVRRYASLSNDSDLEWLVPFYQCYFAYIRGKVESLKAGIG